MIHCTTCLFFQVTKFTAFPKYITVYIGKSKQIFYQAVTFSIMIYYIFLMPLIMLLVDAASDHSLQIRKFFLQKACKIVTFQRFLTKDGHVEISKLAPRKVLVLSQRHCCAGTISKSMPEHLNSGLTL